MTWVTRVLLGFPVLKQVQIVVTAYLDTTMDFEDLFISTPYLMLINFYTDAFLAFFYITIIACYQLSRDSLEFLRVNRDALRFDKVNNYINKKFISFVTLVESHMNPAWYYFNTKISKKCSYNVNGIVCNF